MKLLYEKFAKFAMLRALFFAVMGVATLLLSEFLLGTVFYCIVAYALLYGVWGIVDYCLFAKESTATIRYAILAASILTIAFGVISIVYSRYLVHIAPLYLGGLMLVNGPVYSVAALCAKTGAQWLLKLLSICVLIGGAAIVIFTFGFEIVLTLAQVSSITLFLSCAYELVTNLIFRKSGTQAEGREEK